MTRYAKKLNIHRQCIRMQRDTLKNANCFHGATQRERERERCNILENKGGCDVERDLDIEIEIVIEIIANGQDYPAHIGQNTH